MSASMSRDYQGLKLNTSAPDMTFCHLENFQRVKKRKHLNGGGGISLHCYCDIFTDFPPYRTLIYRIGESFLTLVLCIFFHNPFSFSTYSVTYFSNELRAAMIKHNFFFRVSGPWLSNIHLDGSL